MSDTAYGMPLGSSARHDEAALMRDILVRRMLAWLIDALIVTCLMGCLWVALSVFGVLTLGLGFPLLALLPAVPVIYQWLCITMAGATPGQGLMDLAVRRDADLGPATSLQALVQAIGFYATFMVGWVWIGVALVTARHRALHDIVAGLVVVRAKALTGTGAFWNMAPGGRPIA